MSTFTRALIAAAFVAITLPAVAQSPRLYAPDGTYLGHLKTNQFDPNSVSNQFGRYGNQFSPDSINNQFGKYGNPYSPNSVRALSADRPPAPDPSLHPDRIATTLPGGGDCSLV